MILSYYLFEVFGWWGFDEKVLFSNSLSIWGLPGAILEAHFGILEAPGRSKNHICGSKSIFRRRLCARRVPLASPSGPQWPQVPPNRPQGRPKGAQKEPQEDPKWRENRSKTWFFIKNVKTSKMTTFPHENHIFKDLKGEKIDPKASQIKFLAS